MTGVARGIGAMVAAAFIALGAAPAAAADALPAAAREAFDRGVVAAEQQQWAVAITYFREAQKAAPAAPAIFFNLGLAHAKAGQELPAIAWLQAYLASGPATNADAVRKEIVRLEIATEAKLARVVQEGLAAGRTAGVSTMVDTQAALGDVDGALRNGFRSSDAKLPGPDAAWRLHASFVAETWLAEKAMAAAAHVTSAGERDHVYVDIADALVRRFFSTHAPFSLGFSFPRSSHDLDIARAAAMQITNPARRSRALLNLIAADVRPGDAALAESALANLAADFDASSALTALIGDAADRGASDDAVRLGERLLRTTSAGQRRLPYATETTAVRAIVAAPLLRGDVAAARATARRLLPVATGLHRADLEAVLGNYEPAHALAPGLKCAKDEKFAVFEWIIFTQALTGDIAAAKATTKEAAAACTGQSVWGDERAYALTIVDALVRRGDVTSATAVVKDVRVSAFADAVRDFARRAARVEEVRALEQAAGDLFLGYTRPQAELALADAYEARRLPDDARRLRVRAARAYLAEPAFIPSAPHGATAAMARALEAAGDAAAARAMAAFAAQKASPLVEAWTNAAVALSSDDIAVDLPKVLKDAAALQAPQSVFRLSDIARALAGRLYALRGAALRAAP